MPQMFRGYFEHCRFIVERIAFLNFENEIVPRQIGQKAEKCGLKRCKAIGNWPCIFYTSLFLHIHAWYIYYRKAALLKRGLFFKLKNQCDGGLTVLPLIDGEESAATLLDKRNLSAGF